MGGYACRGLLEATGEFLLCGAPIIGEPRTCCATSIVLMPGGTDNDPEGIGGTPGAGMVWETDIAPREAAARFLSSVIIKAHNFMKEKASP